MLPNFVEAFILNGYSDILGRLVTVICPLCFKRQTLELLLHLSIKVELPTKDL